MDKYAIDKIKKELNLGATGIYPHMSKLQPGDEGELRSAIIKDGEGIIIIFGKPIEWVYLTKEKAIALGKKLIEMAK